MKKFLIFLIIILTCFSFNIKTNLVYASNNSYDESINEILGGIKEEDFIGVNDVLNEFFNEEISFKERLKKFITGEANLDVYNILSSFIFGFTSSENSFFKVLIYLLFMGILCSVINIILSKNNENIENNTIFFIFYTLIITAGSLLIGELIYNAEEIVFNLSKTTELLFPLMFSISSLCGNFGVSVYKPLTSFISYFSSVISVKFLLPLLVVGATLLLVANLSENVKISGIYKTIFSFYKWCLGIIGIAYTVILAVQGIVNASYNGISVKILKYATGSMVPIVGGFLSGGIDVMLSSAILIKNSIGLFAVIFLILKVGGAGIG
ncbi:MAG: hypothetical protein J6Q38_01980, partial [Clostridia bacterium]|nr:hypothetical protein [Clostridia bacterium]